jgi:Mlc titration factor MtfA (ptsG expression regulator)
MGLLMLMIVLGLLVLWAARSSGFLRGPVRLSRSQQTTLAKYALHYQGLPVKQQRQFERTVSIFINDKEWVGAGMAVAEEMKVMISACAAQLLQGFPEVELMHFDRLVVYPDSYRSHRSGRRHVGEVRPMVGMIIISWDDFMNGYAHSHDAHNVGLHEMAHALWFENSIINGEDHFLSPPLLAQWTDQANDEIIRIKEGRGRLFRDYAATNQAEFFATAIEYFFEQSSQFKESLPELYGILSAMLRQDPAALVAPAAK